MEGNNSEELGIVARRGRVVRGNIGWRSVAGPVGVSGWGEGGVRGRIVCSG